MKMVARSAAALLTALVACGPALAASGAGLNFIGYSPDARYFAFEQFGFEDGSGAAYWEIFVVDLKTNEWVKGTPARVSLNNEEEDKLLSDAHAKAMAIAGPVIREKNITEPAELLAANPATQVVPDRTRLAFEPEYTSGGVQSGGPSQGRHEISIESIPLPRTGPCQYEELQTVGFKLTIRDISLGSTRILHEDKSIPASRVCPLGYDLSAVVAHAGYPDTNRMVAIVGVYQDGWEGSDHRFIAVPFTLSD